MQKTISIYYTDVIKPIKETDIYKWLTEKYTVIIDSKNPEFLFYDIFGDDYKKYNNCVKIFVPTEDETANFNECDYAAGFARISYGDRYFHRSFCLDELEPSIQQRSFDAAALLNRKFCNFIYSNSNCGEGAFLRQEFCKKLMKYKHVDCPGKVLNNMDRSVIDDVYVGDWRESKRQFQSQYKFTIAFENDATDGWVTEKMPDAIRAYSIPIYYGDPGINNDFNEKAFINLADYDYDLDKLVQRVIELDNNDEEYLAMLREQPLSTKFQFDGNERFKNWIYSIIEKGNKPLNKDPRNISRNKKSMRAIKKWYRAEHNIPDEDLQNTINTSAILAKNKIYCLKILKYTILYKFSFGKKQKKYKEKYNELIQKFEEI